MFFSKNNKIISNWFDKQIDLILNQFVLNKKFDNYVIYSKENDELNTYFKEHI